MAELTGAELDDLVEQAVVDAHGDDEQLTGLYTMIHDNLTLPFTKRCWASRSPRAGTGRAGSERVPVLRVPRADRPLTTAEQAEVRALSTRARVTATSFTNAYQWGDFRGSPDELMRRYYDAQLYQAELVVLIGHWFR